MNDSSVAGSGGSGIPLYRHFAILPSIMQAWEQRVNAEVPNTAKLNASVLVGAMPLVYYRVIEALSGATSASAQADSTLGMAHGRERALMTEYRPCDLIHELQIFRDVILSALDDLKTVLTSGQLADVRRIIDEVSRDSLNGFNDVREQARRLFRSALSRDVRNVLNVVSVTAQLMEQKSRDPGMLTMAKRIIGKVGEADSMLMSATSERSLNRNLKLKLTIGPVTLLPLIDNVCVDFQDDTGRIQISSDPINGYWSWAAMEHALRNLINYARQAGASASEIAVSATIAFGRILLSLHTTKYFLTIADMEMLSDELDDDTDVHPPDGRGLSYVRAVAEGHGGSLITRSSQATGTTFVINIPLDARPYVES
ncbi:sensor histidine kinase [Pseudoduganella umbonata]|uniref:HAMP domain-containing histidine kinase n=1 Tax=Pseudoduganella umbonata TaxID=864828 RepID=A0A4P8HHV6_9BURK|nr:HAMP domain-containing sensor histidine kinase [Pseudoduganella umbonata]MBB3221694.1 signal transduction histidine kinase [Pseudoduganella umbonata]QCP09083.1 HAMP domain-containing histidine kinase [Pseudoduganella umbonata]